MTGLCWIGLLLLSLAPADEPSERRAIDNLIDRLNQPQQRADVFSSDADPQVELQRLEGINAPASGDRAGWSQPTAPTAVAAIGQTDDPVALDHLNITLPGIHADPQTLRTMIGVNETWSVLTTPAIVAGRIQLLTPSAAVVDGASTVDGAMWMRRSVPLRFVLRKQKGDWRIASIGVMRN
jgi:hypothetical protein